MQELTEVNSNDFKVVFDAFVNMLSTKKILLSFDKEYPVDCKYTYLPSLIKFYSVPKQNIIKSNVLEVL